ncbi:MAG: helix-turn-helix domain-containing protein [Bdellovibrio sp.]
MGIRKSSEFILNSIFLKNRIAELGIKQWWLAEQVGVDRKTVTRWVQGKVRAIQVSNAEALAKILNCSLKDLILENEADQLATPEDQRNAASLIAASSLIEKLGPIGEWNVIEGLLKATIVPNLPLNVLGELYNQLTVASWRQSKIDQADIYNKKAEEIANKCGDKCVLASALLSKANIFSWRGKTSKAIQTYKECLKLERFIEQRTVGSTYSNLGAVLYECGDLDAGKFYQEKAIEIFNFHGKPTNLSIAWCHLAFIYLEKEQIALASDTCEKSISFAIRDDYRRGIQMGELIKAEIFARKGQATEAITKLNHGLEGFAKLGIEEGLNYEIAGRVTRLLGDFSASVDFIRKGISISEKFPIYLAALNLEMSKALAAQGNSIEALQFAQNAETLYGICEAPLRASASNLFGKSIK